MSKQILVVEDNRQYQDILKIALEDAKYSVTLAGEGKSALEKLKERDFDLILLDLLMPGMDGVSFYNNLTNKLKSRIPIIVLTNVTDAAAYGPNIKNVMIKANVSIDDVIGEVKKVIGETDY
ncbi:response regulator [Candidatus Curtissbacteria bacterium]|nr:response regulator [Candidatus Curtissbacteria bacterium]